MVFLTPVVVVCRAPGCQIDAIGVHADDRGFVGIYGNSGS